MREGFSPTKKEPSQQEEDPKKITRFLLIFQVVSNLLDLAPFRQKTVVAEASQGQSLNLSR